MTVLGYDNNKRPGDLTIKAKLGKDPLKEWCCDATVVQHNRGRDENPDSSRRAAGAVGTAMKKAEKKKLSDKETMAQGLFERRIGFLPLLMERNGHILTCTANFLRNIAEVAACRKGHNFNYFRKYWESILANVLMQEKAAHALRKAKILRDFHTGQIKYADDI